jgi:hypothetical protein
MPTRFMEGCVSTDLTATTDMNRQSESQSDNTAGNYSEPPLFSAEEDEGELPKQSKLAGQNAGRSYPDWIRRDRSYRRSVRFGYLKQ